MVPRREQNSIPLSNRATIMKIRLLAKLPNNSIRLPSIEFVFLNIKANCLAANKEWEEAYLISNYSARRDKARRALKPLLNSCQRAITKLPYFHFFTQAKKNPPFISSIVLCPLPFVATRVPCLCSNIHSLPLSRRNKLACLLLIQSEQPADNFQSLFEMVFNFNSTQSYRT